MTQAMGRIMPPFAWNNQKNSKEQNQDNTMNNELTVDEKKSLLSELQSLISSSGLGADGFFFSKTRVYTNKVQPPELCSVAVPCLVGEPN